MTDGIFISYRRDDSLGWSGRIYDQLWPVFGKDRVFFDLDSLYPGSDWDEAIDRTVEQAAVIVLIVGPRWASIEDARGNPRLHKDDDKHAYEVATALASGKPVIPVTIDGAVMPESTDLPERLQRLTKKQAFTLTPAAYYHEIKVLVDLLSRVVEPLGEGDAGDAPDVVDTAGVASTVVAPPAAPAPAPAGEVVDAAPQQVPAEPAGPVGPVADVQRASASVDGTAAELDAANDAEQEALEHARAGAFADAIEIERGVLEARARLLREDHPHTLVARSNVALWLAATGEATEAEGELRSLLDDRRRVLGPQHADTLYTQVELANLLYREGDVEGAKALEEGVLEGRRRTLGDTHPDTLTAMRNLIVSYRALEQYDRAVPILRELAETAERQHGAGSPDHLEAQQSLALSLYEGGDVAEALDLERAVVDGWAASPDAPGRFTAQFVLGCWLRETGDLAGARAVEEEALTGRVRVLGPDDPATLDAAANLAVTLFQLNDLIGSKALFADVAERRRRVLGPDDPDTQSSERALDSEELSGVTLPDDRAGLPSVTAPAGAAPDATAGPTPAEPAPTPVVDRDDAAVAPSGSPGPVVRVSPDGDGDHETVAAAVHSATAGTTVLIGPGRYEGPVVIAQDGIRLVAEGEVLMTTENEPCVVVNGIGCVLTGVALVRRGKKDGAVVQVVAGDLLLEHCDVSGSGAGSVVGVDGPKTTVHLRHATIRDCYSGVAAARMTIEDSHLVALGQTGVDAVRAEWLEMTDTRIESVRRAGIAIGSTAATLGKVTARVSRCEIVGCGDSIGGAVEVGRHSTLELVDSRIERAEGFGLHVAKTGEADVADTMFLSIGQRFLRDKNAKPYRGAVKLAKDGVLRLRGVTVDGHPIEEGG